MYNAHRAMGAAPNARLNELLDQVRAEFDNQTNRSGEYENQITAQMQEMEMIRQKLYTLEQQQVAIKNRYEEEVNRLRHELEIRSGPPGHMGGPPHNQPPHPQPPNIGSGQSGLFQNIISNPAGPGGPGLAPPPEQSQGPQQHSMPQSSGPQPPQQQFNYPPPPNGYGPGVPPQPASPGPGKRPPIRVPQPNTPQQNPQPAYPDTRGSPQIPRPTPPPQTSRAPDVGNQLADLNPDMMPPTQKREGEDWFAVFNPRVQRVLDVELVHNLQHESVVCCVRFSYDGKYVATGCNRAAQIYDVSTGRQITCLQDDSVEKDGDLYIRSVCFSPDGRYLATGAEDKLIRVWDIATKQIKNTFAGHDQDIYSLDFARNGRHIASGSGDRTVRVWDIEQGIEILTLSIEDGVTTVAMSPDGAYVAAGSLDKSVRVWDTRRGDLYERLDGPEGHKDSVYSVAFAPTGRELVSGSLDKTIKMWELADHRPLMGHSTRPGTCIRTFEGHKDFVLSVALTTDGKWVLSGSKDRGVQFWDPRTGDAQLMLQGHKNSVISVAPSPQGQLFATGSGDMRARIWRYKPWRP